MDIEFLDSDDEFAQFDSSFNNILEFTSEINNNEEHIDILSQEESKYLHDGKPIEYDDYTQVHLVALRICKYDPISFCEVNYNKAFIFPYKWDPYTGERLEKDPYGPIYFDPNMLANYFYTNRLRELWHNSIDDDSGLYEGYYGNALGAGEEFHVVGRGSHPEWYVFSLPLSECYLTKDHNSQIVTFGPKLTDEEVMKINNLINKSEYKKQFHLRPPNLVEIKKQYDIAINKDPYFNKDNLTKEEIETKRNLINMTAVNNLKKM
jgi:hypothetical protein